MTLVSANFDPNGVWRTLIECVVYRCWADAERRLYGI